MKRLHLRSSRRRGIAAVEFALTVGVLLSILLGIVELSLLMSRLYTVSRVARDACRIGSGVLEGQDPTGDEIREVAEQAARDSLRMAGIVCDPPPNSNCTVTTSWTEVDDWMMLRVNVAVDHEPFTGLLPMLPDQTRASFAAFTQQQIYE